MPRMPRVLCDRVALRKAGGCRLEAGGRGIPAQGHDDGITTVAEEYLELGPTPAERQAEFRHMLDESWQRFRDAKYWGNVDTDREDAIAGGRVDLKKMLCISDHIDELLAKHKQKKPGAQAEVIHEETEEAKQLFERECASTDKNS